MFRRKRDITKKYRKTISNLQKTSPLDVDFRTSTIQEIKDCRENMADTYYYIMHDAIILYQQGDNNLYESLKKAHMCLELSYAPANWGTSTGFEPYASIKQSLGSVFLACHTYAFWYVKLGKNITGTAKRLECSQIM